VLQEKVPFNERGGKLRGVLDAVSGRFPGFVFGGAVGSDTLPVFHFHDEPRDELEPKLRYLAENGYRTVRNDDIARFVHGSASFDDRRVALCFDDAWTSVWRVAAPLLKQYGLTAIVYAIPGRIEDAAACRSADDAGGPPFVTWAELRALHDAGTIDVQSHTLTHARIFCGPRPIGFVTPAYAATPLLNRPWIPGSARPRFVAPEDLGAPLYTTRSRMSDARHVTFDPAVRARCIDHVSRNGGAAFFERPAWRAQLEAIAGGARYEIDSEQAQQAAIEAELDVSRAILNERLRTTSVRHVCLPWGVSGRQTAAALERLGFETAFANRLRGTHAVRRGDDRFWLKRLPNKYILRLPGRGRRTWL
jgi:hypothetical protein